ncbi:MAG TPA: CvpA family protein [Gammaproteobacteria bacterium]
MDILILLIIVASVAFSVMRGFARDAISLTAWVLAFVIALSLAEKFALILPASIEQPGLRLGISMSILFLATLIMGMVANFMLEGFVNMTKTNNLDKSLGALFGFVRGVLIVCLLVVLGAFISLNETSWWKRSKLLPAAEWVVESMAPFLPDKVARFVKV